MRTTSLTQLHQRAVDVQEMIEKACDRIENISKGIVTLRKYWRDEITALEFERSVESTKAAKTRLQNHYLTILDRINAVAKEK